MTSDNKKRDRIAEKVKSNIGSGVGSLLGAGGGAVGGAVGTAALSKVLGVTDKKKLAMLVVAGALGGKSLGDTAGGAGGAALLAPEGEKNTVDTPWVRLRERGLV
jgi:hypothetical protein